MSPPVYKYLQLHGIRLRKFTLTSEASQVALVVKNPPANEGDIRDLSLIPGQEDPLEEGMATHFSTLAWSSPRTEAPGGLQSTELQRVRHNWSDLAYTRTLIPSSNTCHYLLVSLHHFWIESIFLFSVSFYKKTWILISLYFGKRRHQLYVCIYACVWCIPMYIHIHVYIKWPL